MTNPIAFVATPKDLITDNADVTDAFTQVASVTDANWERINSYLRGWKVVTGKTNQVSDPSPFTLNAWTDYTVGQWPRISLVIPARCACVMVGISACVEFFNPAKPDQYLELAPKLVGANSVPDDPRHWLMRAQSSQTMCSRVTFLPGSQFTAGGTCVINARYFLNPIGVAAGSPSSHSGHLIAAALV